MFIAKTNKRRLEALWRCWPF